MLAGLLCLLPGCPSPSQDSSTLAVINGRVITQSELDLRWADLTEARRAHYGQGGKRQFLDDLITRELLLQEARRLGLDRTPALQERVDEIKEQFILDDLAQRVLGPGAEIPDAELETYIAAHRDSLPADTEIRAAHIVVAAPALARQLKKQLDHGGDFAKLAARHSLDKSTATHGGSLGVIRPGATAPEVESAIMNLKTGAVSDPIKTEAGYHLVKVLSRDSPDPRTIQAAREQLRRELGAEKRLKQYADFIAKLRTNAVIRTEG